METLKRTLRYLLFPGSRLADLSSLASAQKSAALAGGPARARIRLQVRDVLSNFPLLFGGVIVFGLFLTVLFGPVWAPFNPYIAGQHIVPHYDSATETWISPPLSPSAEYLLGTDEYGNDILSMLLYGARNTLVASTFITMVRVLIGLVLGAYAGWNAGGLADQLIMGLTGLITSVPMLVSSMILIFALDIRRGLPVFILALSLIGWTEIAQYIRSEFLVLRKMPFIEGARAMGARNLAIAVRHVLPNLLPQLLLITFLEIGAVLMLLGELGFVGVFIGGGSHTALGDELTGIQVITLIEAPEWGAMLAQGYRWLRAKPFIVFPPAIAFFVAVLGFNTLSEGLRRLIETTSLNTNFLLRKRMVLVVAGLSFATVFIINNTGPAPWFNKVARAFDGEAAAAHTRTLAALEGRGAGQAGGAEAAAYIANEFAAYGLQPGWRQSSYQYVRELQLVKPLTQPELVLLSPEGEASQAFRHQLDFGYMIEGHAGSGQAALPLTFVGFPGGGQEVTWEAYQGLDLRGQIALVMAGNAPATFVDEAVIRGAGGVLWIADERPEAVRSQRQLAYPDHTYLQTPTLPVFRVRREAAETILAAEGISLSTLFADASQSAQTGPGWFARPLDTRMRMAVQLSKPQFIEVPTVLGFLPGSDFEIANELVVLFTAYDGLGIDPDGTIFPAANQGASGPAVLLEIARLWQEQSLNPRRTVLFVAWGGGQLEDPGARAFLEDSRSYNFLPVQNNGQRLALRAVFELTNVGAGADKLTIFPGASSRLAALVEEMAGHLGISVFTPEANSFLASPIARAAQAPWLSLSWEGAALPPNQDTLEQIDPGKLQAIGETLSLVLTQIVREARY
jgi:peptide/nickel transport system permease protein